MAELRVLLVYPGALFSTLDVAIGYHHALLKRDDVKTFTFQFHRSLVYHDVAQRALMKDRFDPDQVIVAASKDVLMRILECRPDWVIFISGLAFPTYLWQDLKQLQYDFRYAFKTAVFLTESPYVEDWETGILERVDCAFTTDYGIIDDYRRYNPNLFYIRHAYDPAVHHPSNGPRVLDLFFVGTGFPERQRLLAEADWSGITPVLYGNWPYLAQAPALAPFVHNEMLTNEQAADKYRQSKVVLNIFRHVQWPDDHPTFIDPGKAKSLSPRCYETLACGSVLLTDWREELADWPTDSFALWGTAEEMADKARWLVAHEMERNRIAANGLAAVQGHTFDARADQILNVLKEH